MVKHSFDYEVRTEGKCAVCNTTEPVVLVDLVGVGCINLCSNSLKQLENTLRRMKKEGLYGK